MSPFHPAAGFLEKEAQPVPEKPQNEKIFGYPLENVLQ